MPGQICPFHAGDWCEGTRLSDGSVAYTCSLRRGHPGDMPWSWSESPPPPPSAPGMSGLSEELDLATELPAALAVLGDGWFEYGLVERSYATRRPEDFARLVGQWGHTAIKETQYSASAYLARILGLLGRQQAIGFHPGKGTGRWSYNADISYWSLLPPADWSHRASWVDVIGDSRADLLTAADACRSYVPG